LDKTAFTELVRQDAPLATRGQLLRVHSAAHIDLVLNNVPSSGLYPLDGDTLLSPGSAQAALRAAGAVCAAVDAVMAGEGDNAFCAVRPPGHHAEPDVAMGFCLFSNVAVGALHARVQHKCHRIAVVDFDVHHGNGTQAVFWNDPDLLLISSHQVPLYPGTGLAGERGVANNIMNLPLPPMGGSAEFREQMNKVALPRLAAFDPDFIFISAGFDAHEDDPLASLCLTDEDFGWVTGEIKRIALHACRGRLVSSLEGGYDLHALASGVTAHVRALMEN
jgi:acetoin utilization deacetylase AcuC-like enzyme